MWPYKLNAGLLRLRRVGYLEGPVTTPFASYEKDLGIAPGKVREGVNNKL